jgi:hypothetical protein
VAITTGVDADAVAWPSAGVLVFIADKEAFPVSCLASVEAPAGSAIDPIVASTRILPVPV